MKKIKPKDMKFARALIKTNGHQGKAYKILHPTVTDTVAQASASRMLANKPEIKQFVVEIMNTKGLDVGNLVGKLKRLTSAKKDNIMPSGEVVKTVDNPTRLQAVKTGLELHGALKTATSINTDRRSININLEGRGSEELKLLTSKLDDLNKALALDDGMQDGEIVDADFSTTDDTISLD